MLIYEDYPDLSDPTWVELYNLSTCHTSMDPFGAIAELDVAVALLHTEGNLARTAKLLRRSRTQVRDFVARHAKLSELYEEIDESFLDEVEDMQKMAVKAGDVQTGRFILSTKGADRGYSAKARLDHTSKDGTMSPDGGATRELIEELNGIASSIADTRGKSKVASGGETGTDNTTG